MYHRSERRTPALFEEQQDGSFHRSTNDYMSQHGDKQSALQEGNIDLYTLAAQVCGA